MEKILFKKIEMWLVFLLAIISLLITVLFGWSVHYQIEGGSRLGKFGSLIVQVAKLPSVILKVGRNPYLISEARFGDASGFTFSYPADTRPNSPFVLINRQDPDAGIGVSELVDLNTQQVVVRQEWPVDDVWKKLKFSSDLTDLETDVPTARFSPVHAILLAEGKLVSSYRSPLVVANACGKIEVFNGKHMFHHSIEKDAEGNYWVATHQDPTDLRNSHRKFYDNTIVKMSPDGTVLFEKSVIKILFENGLGYMMVGNLTRFASDDPIHLNDIQPVSGRSEFWRDGDVFLSLRNLSMVLLYRPETNKIIWFKQGFTIHQHDVDIISDHEISIFNNTPIDENGEPIENGINQYFIYDFKTDSARQPFEAGLNKNELRSATEGRSELLDGNILFFEESNFGRAIAIKPDGFIDWQYINRGQDGKLYKLKWSRMISRKDATEFVQSRKRANCE